MFSLISLLSSIFSSLPDTATHTATQKPQTRNPWPPPSPRQPPTFTHNKNPTPFHHATTPRQPQKPMATTISTATPHLHHHEPT